MTPLNSYRSLPTPVVYSRTSPYERRRSSTRSYASLLIIQYAYCAFVFTIPFESIGFEGGYLSLSKIAGLFFVMTALIRPRMCFRRPPKAFWYFFGYLTVVAIMGPLQETQYTSMIISRILSLTQLVLLFWVSYNLMRDERIVKRTLLTLIIACTILAILMLFGVGSSQNAHAQDRDTALGTNPNTLAAILLLGLLALLGLAFGRQRGNYKALLLMVPCSGILAIEIVRTGSRGSAIAMILSCMIFPLKKTKRLSSKLQLVLIGVLAVGFLVYASYQIEAVRKRWESTFATGEMAGRDKIYSNSWDMFLEKPLFGWGPVTHTYELGARLGRTFRDMHNSYLWVLTEVGVAGAVPFFIGLWLCLRGGVEGEGRPSRGLTAGDAPFAPY